MKKVLVAAGMLAALAVLLAQDRVVINITGGTKPAIALPELRGSGEAQGFMRAFNETVRADANGPALHTATTRRDVIPVALELY